MVYLSILDEVDWKKVIKIVYNYKDYIFFVYEYFYIFFSFVDFNKLMLVMGLFYMIYFFINFM